VPVLRTDFGLRAVDKDQSPMAPTSVDKYLRSKFGERLPEVRGAMEKLARSRGAETLAEEAFSSTKRFGRRFQRESRGGVRKES
jgi:hypothetical protein